MSTPESGRCPVSAATSTSSESSRPAAASSSLAPGNIIPGQAADLRGGMHRIKRLMPDADAREFLKHQKIAHTGSVDANGWPYVTPLCYIYEGGDLLYLHTGDHQGHFLTNLQQNPRICVEVAEMGPLHRGKPYACNSALVYTSVMTFGPVRILNGPESREKKAWFLDRLMEKHGDPSWTFEPGYPLIDRIILYVQQIEVLTGKQSAGLSH